MRYASIRKLDVSNGEGVGISLFTQGCHFHCHNCFNKETWDFECGKPWTEEIENTFIRLAERPYIKRISILGGEPLSVQNLSELLSLINKIRILFPLKTIWIYTGYKLNEALVNPLRKEILSKCDIIVDGEYIDELKDTSLKWRGSSNQKIWRNINNEWFDVTDVI